MVVSSQSGQVAGVSRGGPTFWLLLLLGFATLTPCVLLPEWREYQAIAVAEQVEVQRADAMAALVEDKHRMLDRLHQDPSVVVRMAQRELRYERADRYFVSVEGVGGDDTARLASTDVLPSVEPSDPLDVVPPELPQWLRRWSNMLPPYNYDGVFCDQSVRPILMTMSIALIALAFALYGRRVSPAVPTRTR